MRRTSAVEKAIFGAIAIIGLAVFAPFLFGYVRTFRVPGSAMEPAIPAGSHIVVVRARDVARGDIMAFRNPQNPKVLFVKRVVAIGDDVVEIRDKQLLVNERKISEPYASHTDPTTYPGGPMLPEPYRSRDQFGPYRLPPDHVFVLGDNRDHSFDSRFQGSVQRDHIIGRAVVRYSLREGIQRLR